MRFHDSPPVIKSKKLSTKLFGLCSDESIISHRMILKRYSLFGVYEVLESNAIYNAETKTYLYRPRGLYDYGSTYEPYPEVVSYEKMDDGKIKLIINAVWERTMQDNAMTSELVIQPLDNNRFHYISNQVIKSNLDDTSKWYRNRLTYGEWNKIYKENDEIK